MLTQHLTKIAEQEGGKQADCDIASMHFGMAHFKNEFGRMLAIDKLILEGEIKNQLIIETPGHKSCCSCCCCCN